MTKDKFLQMLKARLAEGGMTEAEIKTSCAYFNEYFSKLSDEECAKKIEEIGGYEGVAASLISTHDEEKMSMENNKPDGGIEAFLSEDEEEGKKKDIFEPQSKEPANKLSGELNDDDVIIKKEKNIKTPAKTNKKEQTSMGMILLSPLFVVIAIIGAALLLTLCFIVIAAVLAFSVALVVSAAAGTALAVIAIIYGITQLSVSQGIGLYEIGLGVICGGITMLLTILMYNFIVRLSPFIFKKIAVLFKFCVKKYMMMIERARELCAKA